LEPGAGNVTVPLEVPGEVRNQIERIEVENEATAAAVALLDERWRRRAVGVVSGGPSETRAQPLLSDAYYLERALAPFSDVQQGEPEELLRRPLSIMLLADIGQLPATERQALEKWIREGGTLVRFAGPRMAQHADD